MILNGKGSSNCCVCVCVFFFNVFFIKKNLCYSVPFFSFFFDESIHIAIHSCIGGVLHVGLPVLV